jgi:hypothetical protein
MPHGESETDHKLLGNRGIIVIHDEARQKESATY